MTITVQASEAKARLLQILDIVERGETVVITRHGRPIARLEPEPTQRRAAIAAAVDDIRSLARRTGKMTAAELLSARDEGRRR
jgi:prevent-host-death family protein